MLTKLTRQKEWVGEMLTLDDKGGRGGWGNADDGLRRGEGGFDPLIFG